MSNKANSRRGGLKSPNAFTSGEQRDVLFFRERERERQVNAEKTTALRTLRLAKEAADAAEAAENPAALGAKPKKTKQKSPAQ